MDEWKEANKVKAFSPSALKKQPAAESVSDPPNVSQIRPWLRYGARMLDYSIWTFCVVLLLCLFIDPVKVLELNGLLAGIILAFLFVFVEPLMISNRATTPGKWMLGISVTKDDGAYLSYDEGMRRSFAAWLKGYGAGVPLVQLIPLFLSYMALKIDGITSWDKAAGSKVIHGRITLWRSVVLILVSLAIVSMYFISAYIKLKPYISMFKL